MTINVKTRGLELSVKYNVLTTIANKPIDEDRIKEQVTKLNNSLFY